jgi:hypothetical protein
VGPPLRASQAALEVSTRIGPQTHMVRDRIHFPATRELRVASSSRPAGERNFHYHKASPTFPIRRTNVSIGGMNDLNVSGVIITIFAFIKS